MSTVITEGVDFDEYDLPHYHLSRKTTRQAVKHWLSTERRSHAITGCWKRPLFSGGWLESNTFDTEAYNFQTPSIFIDIRFPTIRPSNYLRSKTSLKYCSNLDLRILARQHCFAGYTLPETVKSNEGKRKQQLCCPLLFTRHHFIDWNYYPNYPRQTPNRWWIELKSDDTSYKEFSFARDANNVPVYFERWERLNHDSHGLKYLALRKVLPCPFTSTQNVKYLRESIFIVVGNLFSIVTDRLSNCLPNLKDFKGTPNCAAFVDHLLLNNSNDESRLQAEMILDLVGSVGTVFDDVNSSVPTWRIHRSTHPWLQGTSLISSSSKFEFNLKNYIKHEEGNNHLLSIEKFTWDSDVWEVLECSLDLSELQTMFFKQFPTSDENLFTKQLKILSRL